MRTTTVKKAAVGLWVTVMIGSMSLAGCKGRELEEARQEAREAKATVTKIELRLAQALREIDSKKDELNVVRQSRDELQRRVNRLIEERDQASGVAQKAEQMVSDLSSRASGQANTAASLQQQVDELKKVVAQQEATIKEQQALLEVLQKGVAEMSTEIGLPFEVDENDVPIADPDEDY